MKTTSTIIALILIFALISIMAVSAINESDSDSIVEDLSVLINIQSELSTSASTRSISRIINSVIKRFQRALSRPGKSCVVRIKNSLAKLDKVADKLSNRSDFQNALSDLKEKTAIDEDQNGVPDVCDEDSDKDGLAGKEDNCPLTNNPEQKDVDGNRIGDACDLFFCCEDSSLTTPLEECERKTIKSCRQEGNVVVGCLAPKTGRSNGKLDEPISSSPIILNQVTGQNIINFGTGAPPSEIMINTGFFPFNNSQAVITGFNDFNCNDLDITFTPPPGFSGGMFEIGPAGNGFETGARNTIQISGDMSFTLTLSDFPTTNPATGQPFNPQMGDQLGVSLFTQDQVFVNSFFDVFADLDFDGGCRSPLESSSGGATSSSGGTAATSSGAPNTSGGTSSGGTVTTSSGSFVSMLQEAVNMSAVPGMTYMAGTYDCDDFAHELGMELQGQGFDTTFTAIWRNNGMNGHAVTDVHTTSGGIIFVEPQNGMIINLDEDGDGMVGYRDGTHSDAVMLTEGMSEIEVYMDRDAAAMAGVPID